MKPEYRPCIVTIYGEWEKVSGEYQRKIKETHNALFHCWYERFWTAVSPMIGRYVEGQMSKTVAIVEYEDGTIHEHDPFEIRFTDGKTKNYLTENDDKKSKKVYQTMQDDIYYFHDTPKLENSKMIWRMSSKGMEISTDGGNEWETWDNLLYKAYSEKNTSTKDKTY